MTKSGGATEAATSRLCPAPSEALSASMTHFVVSTSAPGIRPCTTSRVAQAAVQPGAPSQTSRSARRT